MGTADNKSVLVQVVKSLHEAMVTLLNGESSGLNVLNDSIVFLAIYH